MLSGPRKKAQASSSNQHEDVTKEIRISPSLPPLRARSVPSSSSPKLSRPVLGPACSTKPGTGQRNRGERRTAMVCILVPCSGTRKIKKLRVGDQQGYRGPAFVGEGNRGEHHWRPWSFPPRLILRAGGSVHTYYGTMYAPDSMNSERLTVNSRNDVEPASSLRRLHGKKCFGRPTRDITRARQHLQLTCTPTAVAEVSSVHHTLYSKTARHQR